MMAIIGVCAAITMAAISASILLLVIHIFRNY